MASGCYAYLKLPLENSNANSFLKKNADPVQYRLPGTTEPSHYRMTLRIDPNKQDSFSGRVTINIFAKVETNEIVLHSNVFAIKNITVISTEHNNSIYMNHTTSDDDTSFLRIKLTEVLKINRLYVIDIDYMGKYGTYSHGLFISSYENADGITKYVKTHLTITCIFLGIRK